MQEIPESLFGCRSRGLMINPLVICVECIPTLIQSEPGFDISFGADLQISAFFQTI